MAELRHLTEHCDFGATLDDMLRDRLVCGIADVTFQRRLLAEDELTLEKAVQLARALETADKDASALQSLRAPAPAEVHSVNRQQKGPQLSPCYRCGGKHKQLDCRFKASVCHACKKRGHLARVCRTRQAHQQGEHAGRRNRRPPNHDHQRPSTTGQTNSVDEGETHPVVGTEPQLTSASGGSYTLYPVQTERVCPIQVPVMIDEASVHMELDTGASLTIISEKTYHDTWPQSPPPLQQACVKSVQITV